MRSHRSTTKPNRRLHPAIVATAVAAVLASTLSSCGSNSSKPTAQPKTTSPTTTQPKAAPANTPQPKIDIGVTDHAFAVSGRLRPGGTIRVSNTGNETHYVQVRKLVAGKSFADAKRALNSQEALDKITHELGAPSVLVWPGHTIEITSPTLAAGQYVLLDWLQVEGTTGTYQTAKGLVGHFSVSGAPATASVPTETYVVSGKAVTGPTALRAGHHVFAVRLDGVDAVNTFPTLIRLNPGRTAESAIKDLADVFGAKVWPVGSGKKLATSMLASAYSPTDGTPFDIGVDLEPGQYVLAGLSYDNNGAPVLGASQIAVNVAP